MNPKFSFGVRELEQAQAAQRPRVRTDSRLRECTAQVGE